MDGRKVRIISNVMIKSTEQGQNCQTVFGSKLVNNDIFLQGGNALSVLPINLKPTDKQPLNTVFPNLAYGTSEPQTNGGSHVYHCKHKNLLRGTNEDEDYTTESETESRQMLSKMNKNNRSKQNVKRTPLPSKNKRAKRITITKKKAQTKREPVKKIRRRTSTGWIDMDTDISLNNDNDLDIEFPINFNTQYSTRTNGNSNNPVFEEIIETQDIQQQSQNISSVSTELQLTQPEVNVHREDVNTNESVRVGNLIKTNLTQNAFDVLNKVTASLSAPLAPTDNQHFNHSDGYQSDSSELEKAQEHSSPHQDIPSQISNPTLKEVNNGDLLTKILDELQTMKHQNNDNVKHNEDLKSHVQKIEKGLAKFVSHKDDKAIRRILPVKTLTDFNKLDRSLGNDDFYNKMFNFARKYCGKGSENDPYGSVLQRIVADDVTELFNLTGIMKKLPLKNHNIVDLLQEIYQETDRDKVESNLRKSIKAAKGRFYSKKFQERKQARQSI